MGFSSLIPSLLTLIQGVGKYECEGAIPHFFPPRFSASSFFFVIFCWTITAMVSFEILSRRDEYTTIAPRISAERLCSSSIKSKNNRSAVLEFEIHAFRAKSDSINQDAVAVINREH
ncbi:hypothetical protein GCK32_012272 [Trichostrongylus colubriformis]|uniref:Riboflavin transporter n=1 Tax=Trichostrongylus colubriformis TaxID=6319 RepID=A0AAN8FVR7_TRICO